MSMYGTTELLKATSSCPKIADIFSVSKEEDIAYLAHSVPLRETIKSRNKNEGDNEKKLNDLAASYKQNKNRLERAMLVSKNRYQLCKYTPFNPESITKPSPEPKQNNPEL